MKVSLNSRSREIAGCLLREGGFLTVSDLAKRIGCSPRMVRYQIEYIEQWLGENGVELVKKKRKGIQVAAGPKERESLLAAIEEKDSYESILSAEERQRALAGCFLSNQGYHPLSELTELLGVSKGTVLSDIRTFREFLRKYGLDLINVRGKGYAVRGNEQVIRQGLADSVLTSHTEAELLDNIRKDLALGATKESPYIGGILQCLQKSRGQDGIKFLVTEIARVETKLDGHFTDTARVALIIHLAIAVGRVQSGAKIVMAPDQLSSIKETDEYGLAIGLAAAVEKEFGVEFPEAEVAYIALHLLGAKRATCSGGSPQGLQVLGQATESVTKTAREMISSAEAFLGMRICDDELVEGLTTHLVPSYFRIRYGLPIRNPLLQEMKENHREIYLAAEKACEVFSQATGLVMPEEEIAYIAMHIGAAMERVRRAEPKKVRVAVVCASGVGTSSLLSSKIASRFPQVEVVGSG